MTTTKTDLAWIAGILDGEGCLCITYQLRHNRKYCSPIVIVGNTDKRMIDALYKLTSLGRVREHSRRAPRKQQWIWEVSRASEIVFLLLEG